jgi:release factor glutamine methyltransferase
VVLRSLELSEHAVAWAAANRDRLGLDVEVVQGDATEPAFPDWQGTVDIVTVNPPYIPVGAVPLDPEVRDHDPELALYGGSEDGLATPVAVARTAAGLLRSGGLLLMEHADSQGDSLPAALERAGQWESVDDHADLTGRPRVASARRR